MSRERYKLIDSVRAILVILMIIYHLMYTLVDFSIINRSLLYNPFMNAYELIVACLFIIISGISSTLSKSNLKRGIKILALAMITTIATYIYNPSAFIVFGILHFLGVAAVIYHFAPMRKINPLILLTLFFAYRHFVQLNVFNISHMWILGIREASFVSLDYFPIFPYIFIYYIGVWIGAYMKEHEMPSIVYNFQCKALNFISRHALLIYVLHQPIFILLIYIIRRK